VVDVGPVASCRAIGLTWPDPVWLALVAAVSRVVGPTVVVASPVVTAAVVTVAGVAVDPHVVRPRSSANDIDSVI
jgi:hypothetical protein